MLRLTEDEIKKKFSPETRCVVSYLNQPGKKVSQILKRVNWKARPQVMTIMFDTQKVYSLGNGECGTRPGIKVEIISKMS